MGVETLFASAERTDPEALKDISADIQQFVNSSQALDAVPNPLVVLDCNRQIVFANEAFLKFAKVHDAGSVLGLRPGEALRCVHASDMASGCGTSEFCRTCGAAQAILLSQKGEKAVKECRITQEGTDIAFDFRVWATPLQFQGTAFTVFTVNDVSHEQRRKALERIFFHDILNTAGGLIGLAELERDEATENEFVNTVYSIASHLVEEIRSQKQLVAAEHHELEVTPSPLRTLSVIGSVAATYRSHEIATGKTIAVSEDAIDLELVSDRTLLTRVLGNMVKNALEASSTNDTVTMYAGKDANGIRFSVHNPSCISRSTQLQIFQRSFSTKGPGRGLGTYSIKLLTERYLNGHAAFESTPASGTTFWVSLPEKL
jgi:signal transduction histidine kinase